VRTTIQQGLVGYFILECGTINLLTIKKGQTALSRQTFAKLLEGLLEELKIFVDA